MVRRSALRTHLYQDLQPEDKQDERDSTPSL